MRHPFEDKIDDFITRHQLLNSCHRYLVALSGGADSVCLLRVLSSLGYEVEAVHCNFHLRGEESDRDEQFCEQLCKEQNTPFHRVHFDTQTFADLHHLSIEMAARELRYQYFYQLSQSIDIQGVCVAHHLDDNVETVLMNWHPWAHGHASFVLSAGEDGRGRGFKCFTPPTLIVREPTGD